MACAKMKKKCYMIQTGFDIDHTECNCKGRRFIDSREKKLSVYECMITDGKIALHAECSTKAAGSG